MTCNLSIQTSKAEKMSAGRPTWDDIKRSTIFSLLSLSCAMELVPSAYHDSTNLGQLLHCC